MVALHEIDEDIEILEGPPQQNGHHRIDEPDDNRLMPLIADIATDVNLAMNSLRQQVNLLRDEVVHLRTDTRRSFGSLRDHLDDCQIEVVELIDNLETHLIEVDERYNRDRLFADANDSSEESDEEVAPAPHQDIVTKILYIGAAVFLVFAIIMGNVLKWLM
ncbi:hypothetical protein QAD02_005787 [Eretmocerus hayati]|uniref:Uncharacterized protein n=1 Tax=Eretmocerus hayati TaxID=131215 RepID=A0ACC2NTI0_9HYME|nr:hypothetical protein QAD02_005787 [Eretmocerus hayati]